MALREREIYAELRPITDTEPATQDTIKHEYEDAGFTGFRFKKG